MASVPRSMRCSVPFGADQAMYANVSGLPGTVSITAWVSVHPNGPDCTIRLRRLAYALSSARVAHSTDLPEKPPLVLSRLEGRSGERWQWIPKKGTPPQWCSGDAGPQSLQRQMGSNAMLSLAPRLDLSNTSLISSPRVCMPRHCLVSQVFVPSFPGCRYKTQTTKIRQERSCLGAV